jgi:hypothetical protein
MRFLLVALDRRGLFRIQEEKDGRTRDHRVAVSATSLTSADAAAALRPW